MIRYPAELSEQLQKHRARVEEALRKHLTDGILLHEIMLQERIYEDGGKTIIETKVIHSPSNRLLTTLN